MQDKLKINIYKNIASPKDKVSELIILLENIQSNNGLPIVIVLADLQQVTLKILKTRNNKLKIKGLKSFRGKVPILMAITMVLLNKLNKTLLTRKLLEKVNQLLKILTLLWLLWTKEAFQQIMIVISSSLRLLKTRIQIIQNLWLQFSESDS